MPASFNDYMKLLTPLPLLTLLVTGCVGQSAARTPTPTPTAAVTLQPTVPTAAPTPTVTVGKPYAAFVTSLCNDFRSGNADGITNLLMYYQYNSGLRYGMLGDGEGQTADPSVLRTWLQGHHVRCTLYSPGQNGHGVLLTNGWDVNKAHWSLVEVDLIQGRWKINDFTFGSHRWLTQALQVAAPILSYRG